MKPFSTSTLRISVSILGCTMGTILMAHAQETPGQSQSNLVENAEHQPLTDSVTENEIITPEYNPDESADDLNSRQQLKQTFTLRRTLNGELVETSKRVVTYDPTAPYRETEAGGTTINRMRSAFDGELLTRVEALDEAKLDFTVADINNDGTMTINEFEQLVVNWQETGAHNIGVPDEEITRQRQYDAFIAEIDPESSHKSLKEHARKKFQFLSGVTEQVSLKDYIREYLLDFDSMDEDSSTTLSGNELVRFRALNNGEQ